MRSRHTASTTAGPENICLKTNIMFLVLGDDLDPKKITAMLRIRPTRAYAKGDSYKVPRVGIKATRSIGHWSFGTDGKVHSTDIETHARYLLDKLEPQKTSIRKLLADPKRRLTISIWWEIREEHGVLVLSSDSMRRLACLCRDIRIHLIAAMKR